jgi:limonene-1,2-epoxide hydrolase
LERRDSRFIVEHFADDGVYHSTPLSPIIGKAAIRDFVAKFAGVPPGQLQIRHQPASVNIVMSERTDRIFINDKLVTLPICGVFEIEYGLFKAWREYFDIGPAKAAYGETPDPS